MIDNKYLELMHKDIDKIITPAEKIRLENYLLNNPEAANLYNELIETENLLDTLPQTEPSENLKKRILNSIDYNRYSKTRTNPLRKFADSIFGRKPGFALTFSLGLAGILLIGLFISNPGLITTLDQRDAAGTMGLKSAARIAMLNIDGNGISGTVEIIRGTDKVNSDIYKYAFSFDLISLETYEMEIIFDTGNISLEDITSADVQGIEIAGKGGKITVNPVITSSYTLLFESTEFSESCTLRITSFGRNLYERQISIR
jgi:hypothetical protein